jgi:hypothetical protein
MASEKRAAILGCEMESATENLGGQSVGFPSCSPPREGHFRQAGRWALRGCKKNAARTLQHAREGNIRATESGSPPPIHNLNPTKKNHSQ